MKAMRPKWAMPCAWWKVTEAKPAPDAAEHSLVHFGLSVSDLHQAVAFFVEFLGFTLVSRLTPHDPDAVAGIIGVPGARVQELANLRKGDWQVELLRFDKTAEPDLRQPHERGYFHLLVHCDAFDRTIAAAAAYGFTLMAEPYRIAAGPNQGKRGTYLRHRDGFALEVIGK